MNLIVHKHLTFPEKKCLSLKQMVEPIHNAEKSKKGVNTLAEEFGISKTSVSATFKRKAIYLEAFEKK